MGCMPDFEQIAEIKKRAQSELFAIPGVHAVGIGSKITGGERTAELAIMVFVVKKKPLSELAPNELIPTEIEGVKTDVYESGVPRTSAGEDNSKHRPLVGGVQIQAGGGAAGENDNLGGTLGCIAHTDEPNSRVVGLTCDHVVSSSHTATPTKLKVQSAFPVFTFTGENTPGSMVRVRLPGVDIYFVTGDNDTLDTIAAGVAEKIIVLGAPSITAGATGAQVTVTGANNGIFTVFSPAKPDKSAKLHSSISGTTISLSGKASGAYIAYVKCHIGEGKPTFGAFVPILKGDGPSDVAGKISKAINNRAVAGISADPPQDAQVRVNGVQAVECYINSDTRVGQPTDCFPSKCSKCCDKRIGVVIESRADIDLAVIQLDGGLEYRAEIAETAGAVSGSRPLTPADLNKQVSKRGRKTGLTSGTVLALQQDGDMSDADPEHNPPEWEIFNRHYVNATSVQSGGVPVVPFSAGGDSGAAVVITSGTPQQPINEVVGIMFGTTSQGNTVFTPIEQITSAFAEFPLIVETADQAGVTKTVPKLAHALAPGDFETSGPVFAPILMERFQKTHREITSTPAGCELAAVFERHADEAQQLVNTNRRVATVWHRNGGPQILQGLLTMLQSPEQRLPDPIEGKPLKQCLLKIQKAFERYASSEFAADLARFGPRLIELSGLNYSETLAGLRRTAAT